MRDWQQQIVLVSPFFFPELISTGKANRHLAEACAAECHGVTVVCSHPIYPEWRPVPSRARIEGLKILRGGAWMRYPKSMPLRRLMLEIWFALYAARKVWRLRKTANVVVSVLPPSTFALFLNLLLPRSVRRVAIVHDLQGVLAAQEKSTVRRVIARLVHAVESRVFHSQDVCIFFSEDMARMARNAYALDPARVAVQYPCVTLDGPLSARGNSHKPHRLISMVAPERLHVVYSGALGFKQNSQQLLAFMQAAAKRHPAVDFHVLSGGPFFEELKKQYEGIGGPRVQFHPLVPERDLAELYARSSIHLIPQAEGTEAAALPSKLPNLMSSGVHLLAICPRDSEVGRLVERAGTGNIVERWDENLFLEKLDESLTIVRTEPASARRSRVEPLLELFSTANMTRLVLGEDASPKLARPVAPEPAEDLAVTQSGVR